MKELGVMEQELTEFQRRYGREIHFPKLTDTVEGMQLYLLAEGRPA